MRALSFVLPTFFLSFARGATLGWFIALVLLAARPMKEGVLDLKVQ